MKKFGKSLIVLGLAASSICGIGIAGFSYQNEEIAQTLAATPSTTYPVISPDIYYASFDDSGSGDAFLSKLRTFNMQNRKSNISYGSLDGIFCYTDYDPSTVKYDSNGQAYGTKLLSFYSGKSTTSYNKEHVWPNSRGGGSKKGKSGSPYVEDDVFMPRPTITEENSDRGNSSYVEGMCHSSNGWDPVTAFEKSLGVYESIRGECARIIFYCMTVNSKLRLVDDANTDFAGSGGRVTMGKLSDMLKWHLTNPVNERENNRQSGGQYLQGNRNAFVDHRSYACKIWGNTNSTTKSLCDQYNGWTDGDEPITTKTLTGISITGTANKLVYNVGESFQTAGLTVIASYNEDGVTTTENVTSKVSVSPNPLTVGTTSVTLSYTDGTTTKSATYSGITVSKPASKTLSSISVSGSLTKSVYDVGDSFNMNGLIVTANFSDGSTSDVTNSVTFSPTTIQVNTSKVTFSYTYQGVTKTVDFTNLTVKSSTFYGTEEEPLIPTEAMAIIRNECKTAGTFTNEQIYCRATIKSFDSKDTANGRLKNVIVTDGETDILIFTLNMSLSSLSSVAVSDEILFHGYGANYNGNLEFTYRNLSGGGSADVICDKFYNKIIPVTSVTFGTIDTNVYTGDVVNLPVVVLPQDATDKTLRFASSDPSVATVDTNGQVTFLKGGTVTFTASSVSTSGKSSQITFNVQNRYVPVESISVSPTGVEVDVDTTQQLNVVVSPVTATNKNVSYISSDTRVATVNSNGLVSFVGAGEVDITVRGADSKFAVAHFTVVEPVVIINVREINLSESSVSLEVGETKELDYELVPENATDKSVMWTSSNNKVARVSDDGEITAYKAGTATITISTLDKSISDTCFVTVIDKPQPVTKTLVEIVVAKNPDKTTYELNEPYDETGLVIEAHYLDGSSEDVTNQCDSNKDNVKTSSVGLSRINYTYKTFSIFVNIYVLDNQPTELKITKNPLKLNYFAEEEFSTIGLEVKAVIGGVETIVTNLVNISYDFESENKFVTIEFGGLIQQIEITIETGTITVEHKAVDYTYVFEDKLGETAKDKVTLDSWKILEYYYNSLDDATKEALKSVVTAYGNGEVSAAEDNAEKLKECVSDYDEIYLLHKDEGFNDFMKRSPKAPTPTPTPDPTPAQGLNPLIVVGIIGGVVVLIILIIVISVSASKKGKKKHA